MKVYKVEDLENFERDEYGRLICPSGDYTQEQIKESNELLQEMLEIYCKR